MPVSVASRQGSFVDEFCTKFCIISLDTIQLSRSILQPNLPRKSKTGQNSLLTKRNTISCILLLNTMNIMSAGRRQLHSRKTTIVSYYNLKRIIKDRKSHSEITVGSGHLIVQKVSPNENYIVRRVNTNETQKLQRMRIKNLFPINRLKIVTEKRD